MNELLLEAHAARAQAIAQGLLGSSTHERMEAFSSLVWLALDLKFAAWNDIRTRCWQLQVQREVEYAADATISLRFVPSKQNLCALGASLAGVERTAESWYADPPQAPDTCQHCTCYLERVLDGD